MDKTKIKLHVGLTAALLFLLPTGCLKHLALSSVADGLSGTGGSFASDDDPELVGAAVPFALKTMESLLPELPNHIGLHVAACSGFTEYAYAFVLQPAAREPVEKQRLVALRAKKLFVRARGYCLQALNIAHPGFSEQLNHDRGTLSQTTPVIAELRKEDVPALYWLSASTALAVTSLKEQFDYVKELPIIDVLIRRAQALDDSWDDGSIEEFLIAFDGGRSPAMGGSIPRARQAFARAVELSHGHKAGPYVSLAENVSVAEQNRKEFDSLLKQALAVDIEAVPQFKLANVLAQRRAKYLRETADDLILGDTP